MNGNTAELYGWPLNGGGGTVCPDSICALRRAEQSRAEQSRASNTVLLGRSSEDCCLRKAFPATGDSAVHKANTTDTTYPAQLGGVCRFAGGASRLGRPAHASIYRQGTRGARGRSHFPAARREREPRVAAVQASACHLDPAQNQFPFASCAGFPDSGGFFTLAFSDFELKQTIT